MEQLKILSERSGNQREGIRLTKRDLEVLRFVLEMKFVSIDEIYERFFKVKMNGEISKSNWWARDRVYQLKKQGFLRAVSFYTEARSFYVATSKAYHLLRESYSFEQICFPSSSIEIRTFRHDWLVTKCRLELEKKRGISSWVSEKVLKSEEGLLSGLPKKYMPDAIYSNSFGEKVAFELELATKAKARYQQKVRLYSKLMRQNETKSSKGFGKCLYVCQKDSVADLLRKFALPFGNQFEILMLSEFVSEDKFFGGQR